MMKRNRLIDSSSRANIFSNKASRFAKRRHIMTLSLLTIIGVFITSIVLATSSPSKPSTQSITIDLPNLPVEMQRLSNAAPTISTIKLPNNDFLPSQDFQLKEDLSLLEIASIEEQELIENVITNVELNLNWQEVTIKSGDNLSRIFPRVGLTARDVYNVAQLGTDIKPLLNLIPGQTLRFGLSTEQGSPLLQQLQLVLSPIKTLKVFSTAEGLHVSLLTRDVEQRQMHTSGVIENSLFEAGIKAGLSDKLVMELAYIFGWDIDFALDLRKQDHFQLIYSEDYLDGDKIADGAILAAEFTNQGKTFRAVRYTDESGSSRYYSPEGDSMRKAFSRSPVHFSRISSRFNPNRKHPVLKTSRPHRGVDYAAARGTPILATGDGKIDFRGTEGGYGRTIILTHGGKYTTLYAHMSSYKRGLKRGSRVKQGQTIGFIGSSGLATGPHLHYEFRVNGVHRNPLTVKLPKAEPLPKKYLIDFKQQSQLLLAQLDSLNNTALALND